MGERDRIEHAAGVAVPDAAERARGVDLASQRRGVERTGIAAEPADERDLVVDLVELVALGRDPEHAGRLVEGVDPMAGESRVQLGEALGSHPLELAQLALGEAAQAVAESVRERGLGKAAVAPGGPERDVLGLDEEHVARRLALLRDQRRPEAGEPAAHDREVARDVARDGGARLRRGVRVQPVGPRHGIGEEMIEATCPHGARSLRPASLREWSA